MLAWVALSRSDLTFSVSYLARSQTDPRQSLEACMKKPVAVDSAGREPAQDAVFPHAEAAADLRADGARGLR